MKLNSILYFAVGAFDIDIGEVLKSMSDAASAATRTIFASIDAGIYNFYSFVLKLFFDLAGNSSFMSGPLYITVFRRIFLILGIFMFFKLTISFLQYLISPDSMNDKEKGAGKVIARTITSIVFLFFLMPVGAHDKNAGKNYQSPNKSIVDYTYEDNVREQGLLFGTLQSMQTAIVKNDVLGKLILGTGVTDESGNSINSTQMLENTAHNTVMSVFGGFYKFNKDSLSFDSDMYSCLDSSGNAIFTVNSDVVDNNSPLASMDDVINTASVKCYPNGNEGYYMFDYQFFISTVVGLVIIVLTFLFTFDVALRMIKLSVLRLISPIPAISYISPKSSKDGAFSAYVGVLTKTYLDLFLRMSIIYIVILFMSQVVQSNDFVKTDNPASLIIIIIALLFFGFQAPKFIKQALGIKDTGAGLGFGAALLGGALSGATAGFAAGGLWGGVKGLVGGAAAGGQNQWAAQLGQKPNMTARQAAMNKAAQMATHNPNAKGVGLGAMLGGGLANFAAGTTDRRIDRQKNRIEEMQANAAQANEVADILKNGGKYDDLTDKQKAIFAHAGVTYEAANPMKAAANLMDYASGQSAAAAKAEKKMEKAKKQHDKNSGFSDRDSYHFGTEIDDGSFKSTRYRSPRRNK